MAKPLVWLADTIRTPPFSAEGRRRAGALLRLLQEGERLDMPHSRPMPSIGPRCHELRIPDARQTWRILYRIDSDAIVVVHVFTKKTRTTPRPVIQVCRQRLAAYDAA